MNNGLAGTKLRMFVGRKHAGERWADVLVESEQEEDNEKKKNQKKWKKGKGVVQISSKGYADFPVSSMSASVWVNVEAGGRKRFGHDL